MADIKHSFSEVKGKTVDSIELTDEADYYGITIRFGDKTVLAFAVESRIFTFPVLEDWTTGEAKIIKKYQIVQ